MGVIDRIKSIIKKPLDVVQGVRKRREEYHREGRFRCPECGGIFSSKAEYYKHWNEVHSNVEKAFGKAYKKVIHEKVPALIPAKIKEATPPIVKEGVETAEKASSSMYKRAKKGPLPSRWTEERIVCPYCGYGRKPSEKYLMTDKRCPNEECHQPNPYLEEAIKDVQERKLVAGFMES
jgi:uncharacterized C2H2 Zn-finger protein